MIDLLIELTIYKIDLDHIETGEKKYRTDDDLVVVDDEGPDIGPHNNK